MSKGVKVANGDGLAAPIPGPNQPDHGRPEPTEAATVAPPGCQAADTDGGGSPPAAAIELDQMALPCPAPTEKRPSGLKRGGIQQHLAAKRERERQPMSRADVLRILQEIAADPDQSGAYRTAAARILLMPEAQDAGPMVPPEAGQVCGLCNLRRPTETLDWLNRRPDPALSPSVQAWLEGLPDAPDKPNGNGHDSN